MAKMKEYSYSRIVGVLGLVGVRITSWLHSPSKRSFIRPEELLMWGPEKEPYHIDNKIAMVDLTYQ
jgi:hypothetical protein